MTSDHPSSATTTRFLGWWILLVCGVAVYTGSFGLTYTVSVYIDPMLAELGISRTVYSLAYALGTGIGGVILLVMGRPLERLGSRRVLIIGAIGLSLGLVVLSLTTGPWLLFLGFPMIRTFGQGMTPLATRVLVPNWFYRHRARAFSMLGLASTAAIATLPLANSWAIGVFGWRLSWRIASVAILIVIIPLILLVIRNRPEELGQLPDGARVQPGKAPPVTDAGIGLSLAQIKRTRAFWILVVAGSIPPMITTGQHLHQHAMFIDRGTPHAIAAATFTIEAFSMLIVNLLMGWLNHRINSRIAMSASLLGMVMALVCLLYSANPIPAMLYGAFRGGSNGAMNIAVDLAWPNWYGRKHLASIRSFGMAASLIGSAFGPIPFGMAADLFGGYPPAIIGMMIVPLVMAVLMLFAKPPDLAAISPR